MRRFYKDASHRLGTGGFEIFLDERPVKTPARAPLVIPSEDLADGIAAEWRAQGDKIEPRSMPLTGLANAAIDRVAPDEDAFAKSLSLYGESDLICYRAGDPAPLVRRQCEAWDPLLSWARRRFDIDFEIVQGIMHRPQPDMTLRLLEQAVAARNAFELAAMSPLVTISGSLVIALALVEDAVSLDEAWAAATVDEAWQAEQWGEDVEAARVLEARRNDFAAAYRFLKLL